MKPSTMETFLYKGGYNSVLMDKKEILDSFEEKDGRPDKEWWNKCVSEVNAGMPDYTDEQVSNVCGWRWYKHEETGKKNMEVNMKKNMKKQLEDEEDKLPEEELPEEEVEEEKFVPTPKKIKPKEDEDEDEETILSLMKQMINKLDMMSMNVDKALNGNAKEISLNPEGGAVKLPKAPTEEIKPYGSEGQKDAMSDESGASFTEKTKQVVENVLKHAPIEKSFTPRPNTGVSSVDDIENKKNITGMDVIKAIRDGKRFEDVSRIVKNSTKRNMFGFPEGGM